jgi:hypothetical protein
MVDRDAWDMGTAEAAYARLAEAAGAFARDAEGPVGTAPSAFVALWDAAGAVTEHDGAEDVTSGDAAAGLAIATAEAVRAAVLAVAADMLAGTFGAVADVIAARLGAGASDVVDVTWSDSGEDVGMVMPVAATYGDAFAVVDAWSEGPTWVATLADMLAEDVADVAGVA